jgi:Ca-activated chloride channel homolog
MLIAMYPFNCTGQAQGAKFSVRTNLVLVNATVLNRNNQFVIGLHRSDFVLKVDRRETPIAALSLDEAPVSTVIVMDVSGSMKPALRAGAGALRSFLNLAWIEDEYGLVICGDDTALSVPLTRDMDRISEPIPFLNAKGSTPLFDSIERAVHLVRRGQNPRKVVVVITDGEDTSSRLTALELRRLLAEADIHLYVIQLWTGSASDDRFVLREAAEETGGSFFSDVNRKHLTDVISKLDVHWQYEIAFQPDENVKKSTHMIQLRLAKHNKAESFQVFSRHQYTQGSATSPP